MKNRYLPFITVLVVIVLWQLQAMRVGNPTLFPYPWDTLKQIGVLLSTGETYRIVATSLVRLIFSAGASAIMGITVGILAGLKPWLSLALTPLVSTLRTLPVASLIVVILILFGQQFSLYVITFLMLFPINYEAAKAGIINIDKSLQEVLLMETDHLFGGLFSIRLPLGLPYIKTGFLQSIGIGFKVLVVAEFIAQTPNSLGYALYMGRITIAYDIVFAWTVLLIVIVITIEHFIRKLNAQ